MTQPGQFEGTKGNPRRRGAAHSTKSAGEDIDGHPGEAGERTCKGRTPSESRGDGLQPWHTKEKAPERAGALVSPNPGAR